MKNNYNINIEQYCTRTACMDCEYFNHEQLVRVNKNCPLLKLKEEALHKGYKELLEQLTKH